MSTAPEKPARQRAQPHRVLLLIDHLELGGAQRHVALLAKELHARGHVVQVAHSGAAEVSLEPEIPRLCLCRERVARSDSEDFRRAVVKEALEFRPTIIHAHLFASALAASEAAAEMGVPLVLSHHSAGTWQQAQDRLLLRRALLSASHHFTASPQIRLNVIRQGVSPIAVEFLPNAIDLPSSPVRRRPVPETLRAGFMGRLCPDKDPLLALHAVAKARANAVPVTLELRGEGELAEEVAATIRDLGLEAAVRRHGFEPEPDRFFAEIDVLLLSSRSEGMPLAVLEAMAHELPVVATRVGAVPEEVAHAQTGLVVSPGSSEELAAALAWMHVHRKAREAMGRAGRRRVEAHFTIARQADRVELAYDRLAAEEPRLTSAPA